MPNYRKKIEVIPAIRVGELRRIMEEAPEEAPEWLRGVHSFPGAADEDYVVAESGWFSVWPSDYFLDRYELTD